MDPKPPADLGPVLESPSPSPTSSISSVDSTEAVNNNKRKRIEDNEGNTSKRRSEEPLFKIVNNSLGRFVDETVVDDDKEESKSLKSIESGDSADSSTENEEEEHWEVEEIVDYQYCRQSEEGLYLVKWIGWESESNTWEPEAHLECTDLLINFYKTRLKERESATPAEKRALELPPDPRESFQIRQDYLKENCPPPSKKELDALFQKNKLLPPSKKYKLIPEKLINAAVDQLAKSSRPNENKLKWIREQLMIREMFKAREAQLDDLVKYEKEINTIDPHAHVSVFNDADLEGPPRQMQYINAYKASEGISIPDDPFIGCSCETCGIKTEKRCCSGGSGGFNFAYTKHNKLRIDVGCPIYECNKRCSCGPDCINRVVQKGRKHKLAIFRTDNGCGWGVKALEHIRPGSFVVEYVGEVITSEQAEERGKKYDAEGRTYLFDLDFNLGDENLYTVDAAFYGNLSHFINHSCDPNLNIFNVYINCLDPNMPQLCLFAKKEIKKGEQITFDYCQSTSNTNKDEVEGILASPSSRATSSSTKNTRSEVFAKTECRCGADNCRKVLF